MNQILSVQNNNNKKKSKNSWGGSQVDINKVVKFLAITMIIFGTFIIGSASYSMYKQSQQEYAQAKPTIHVEEPSEELVIIKVEHTKDLSKLTYYWNNEEPIEVQCQGKTFEQNIEVPTGVNTLNVCATDVTGQETRYQKTYTLEGDISIDFTVEGNDIKVTVEGKNELTYLTYRWDEEEEIRVDINDMSIDQTIEIPRGLHKLTVIAVDINNTTETKSQEINGVTKPKVEVTTDGSDNFIIHATDEQGLKKIEFVINEDEKYLLNIEDNRKELEYAYPLHEGENRLEIRVYNINDVIEVTKVLVNK